MVVLEEEANPREHRALPPTAKPLSLSQDAQKSLSGLGETGCDFRRDPAFIWEVFFPLTRFLFLKSYVVSIQKCCSVLSQKPGKTILWWGAQRCSLLS